jgi:hypothetical protein
LFLSKITKGKYSALIGSVFYVGMIGLNLKSAICQRMAASSAASKSNKMSKDKKDDDEFRFIDVSSIPFDEMVSMAEMIDNDKRKEKVKSYSKPANSVSVEEVMAITPMKWSEELAAMAVFLFGVPGFALTFPFFVIGMGMIYGRTVAFMIFAMAVPLVFVPYKASDKNCYSWLGLSCLRYFSYKGLYRKTTEFKKGKPYILVAPPHGE